MLIAEAIKLDPGATVALALAVLVAVVLVIAMCAVVGVGAGFAFGRALARYRAGGASPELHPGRPWALVLVGFPLPALSAALFAGALGLPLWLAPWPLTLLWGGWCGSRYHYPRRKPAVLTGPWAQAAPPSPPSTPPPDRNVDPDA